MPVSPVAHQPTSQTAPVSAQKKSTCARRLGFFVVITVVYAALLACSSTDGPAISAPVVKWNTTEVLCQTSPGPGPDQIDSGVPVPVTQTSLESASCQPTDSNGDLKLSKHSYLVYTGHDRTSVKLDTVASTSSELVLLVTVPGKDCVVTADYRGLLSLVLSSDNPDASSAPNVTLKKHEADC